MTVIDNRAAPSIMQMSAPLMVSFVMRAAFSLVDTFYAATIGDEAVAAIGLTIPLEFFMIAVWVGLSSGLTSALSHSMGAQENDKIDQYLKISWRLATLVSPLFIVMGAGIWLVAPSMGLEADVARSFQIYGLVLIGGSAFTAFWSIMPDSLIKAHQDTRSTMWAGIWSNVINVVLNTLFLFVFGWGIFGIALSTVLSRLGGLWYAMVKAAQHERRRKGRAPDASRPGLDTSPLRTILRIAVPSSLTFALMAAEAGLVNALLARLEHATEAIAAYSIYYRVVLFAFNPVIATAVAMLPYSARRFGDGDVAGVRRGLRQANLAMGVYSIVLVAPVMLVGAPFLARWLTESMVSEEYTAFALRLVPAACLIGVPFLLCRPVFEGMQRGGPGLVMACFRYIVLTAPLGLLGIEVARRAGQPELYGLVLGLLAAGAISSAAFTVWLRVALVSRQRAGAPHKEPAPS